MSSCTPRIEEKSFPQNTMRYLVGGNIQFEIRARHLMRFNIVGDFESNVALLDFIILVLVTILTWEIEELIVSS